MNRVDSQAPTPIFNQECVRSTCQKLLVITSLALMIISLLALLNVHGLNAISDYWFYFTLAGIACLVLANYFCSYPRHADKTSQHRPDSQVTSTTDTPTTSSDTTRPSATPPRAIDGPNELFARGQKYDQKKDDSNAFNSYLAAVKKGHLEANFYLALCYEKGKGTQQSIEQAIVHYQTMAQNGHLESIVTLAILFLDQNNPSKTIQMIKKMIENMGDDSKKKESWNQLLNIFESEGPNDPKCVERMRRVLNIERKYLEVNRSQHRIMREIFRS